MNLSLNNAGIVVTLHVGILCSPFAQIQTRFLRYLVHSSPTGLYTSMSTDVFRRRAIWYASVRLNYFTI